jgi:hypothetical protein
MYEHLGFLYEPGKVTRFVQAASIYLVEGWASMLHKRVKEEAFKCLPPDELGLRQISIE